MTTDPGAEPAAPTAAGPGPAAAPTPATPPTSSPLPRVVYVIDRFPVRSQTFVSQEWERLLAQDPRTQMISLRRAAPDEQDPRVRQVADHRVALVTAHLAWLAGSPRRYARYLRFVLRCGRRDVPWLLMAPLVDRWAGHDVVLHTHFAHQGALVTRAVAEHAPARRSLVMHALDIFTADSLLATRCEGAALATISEYNRRYLAAEHGLGDIALVPCGVSDPGEAGLWSPLAPKRHDVLAVGRLVPKKGFAVLLDALALCAARGRRLSLLLIGDDVEAERLRAQAVALGIDGQVTFAGAREHAEVLQAMVETRVLVVPSVVAPDGDMDGIPVVLLEAMVRGVPVVASSLSGVTEVLDEDCGWLVPPGDPDALAQVIEQVLDAGRNGSEDEANSRRLRARQRILATHTLEQQVEAVLALCASAQLWP